MTLDFVQDAGPSIDPDILNGFVPLTSRYIGWNHEADDDDDIQPTSIKLVTNV